MLPAIPHALPRNPQDPGAKPEPGAPAGCDGCLNFIVDSGCYGEGLARDQSETPGARLLP
jgi:hypothetical protein